MRHLLKKYVQRRPNATTAIVVFTKVYVERIFYFFCFHGWSKGACFLHLLREDYRSSLKVENFLPKGVSFSPSISLFTMREYEGYACKSLLPTNGDGGKSLEEEIILSETGINGPAFSPFIMKGYAGHL